MIIGLIGKLVPVAPLDQRTVPEQPPARSVIGVPAQLIVLVALIVITGMGDTVIRTGTLWGLIQPFFVQVAQ